MIKWIDPIDPLGRLKKWCDPEKLDVKLNINYLSLYSSELGIMPGSFSFFENLSSRSTALTLSAIMFDKF